MDASLKGGRAVDLGGGYGSLRGGHGCVTRPPTAPCLSLTRSRCSSFQGAIHVQDGSDVTFAGIGDVTLSSNYAQFQGGEPTHLARGKPYHHRGRRTIAHAPRGPNRESPYFVCT